LHRLSETVLDSPCRDLATVVEPELANDALDVLGGAFGYHDLGRELAIGQAVARKAITSFRFG